MTMLFWITISSMYLSVFLSRDERIQMFRLYKEKK